MLGWAAGVRVLAAGVAALAPVRAGEETGLFAELSAGFRAAVAGVFGLAGREPGALFSTVPRASSCTFELPGMSRK